MNMMSIFIKKKHRFKMIMQRSLFALLIVAMLGTTYSLGVAVSENIIVDQMINQFIKRAPEEPTSRKILYNFLWNYYAVPRSEDYELSDTRDVFYDDAKREIGNYGDILLTRQSAFRNIPMIHQFFSYYFGGHASFISDTGGIYETTGMNIDFQSLVDSVLAPGHNSGIPNASIQKLNGNYWLDKLTDTRYAPFYRGEIMSVRQKNISPAQIDLAQAYLEYHYQNQSLYNFLFWLNMKDKHYCSDLVSRAYQAAYYPATQQSEYSKSLNDDGFITSINDILLSQTTYLTSYIKIDTNHQVINIYYLADLV